MARWYELEDISPSEIREELIDLVDDDWTNGEIGSRYGISASTVARTLKYFRIRRYEEFSERELESFVKEQLSKVMEAEGYSPNLIDKLPFAKVSGEGGTFIVNGYTSRRKQNPRDHDFPAEIHIKKVGKRRYEVDTFRIRGRQERGMQSLLNDYLDSERLSD